MNHVLLEQIFYCANIEMTKMSVHQIKGDFGVCHVINFCWNIRWSVRSDVVKIVEVLAHSASEDKFICLGVQNSASSVEKFDPASSFVKPRDREKGNI